MQTSVSSIGHFPYLFLWPSVWLWRNLLTGGCAPGGQVDQGGGQQAGRAVGRLGHQLRDLLESRNDWSLWRCLEQHLHVEVQPEKAIDGKDDYQVLSRVAQTLVPIELKWEINGKWDEGVDDEEEVEDVAVHQTKVWPMNSFFFLSTGMDTLAIIWMFFKKSFTLNIYVITVE